METFKIEHLSFTYPNRSENALNDISLTIEQGQFVTLCGKSGCGKTTFLRLLKTILTPHGSISGNIIFEGAPLNTFDQRVQSKKIGFVLQSPDNQIVTDKVWHELAFGLESLGYGTLEIRTRVAEMASYFGIQTWFQKNVTELSGGQKQLLNLAAVMVMQPSVLILDEPTGQLDPIAASDFFETIGRINRELGTTVILAEHRLEDVFPISDRVIVMDSGKIIADGTPRDVGVCLKKQHHDIFLALPTPMRVYSGVENSLECPLTVRDGRRWLEKYSETQTLAEQIIPDEPLPDAGKISAIELSQLWFRYDRSLPDVVKGLSAKVYEGELFAIVGGNGTGKTTSLSIMTGILKPYRGEVKLFGRKLDNISDNERYGKLLGVLPQNPQVLFVKKTVEEDLFEMFSGRKLPKDEQRRRVAAVSNLCELDELLPTHPYDLSGGEQQRAALAKVLLLEPRILLLDEPTKGLDGHFKEKLAGILKSLQASGVTIVMVSHDIEFCASNADRCAMFFDGNIISTDTPRRFFSRKSFYTTAANRMARNLLPDAVLAEDIILACGGDLPKTVEMQTIGSCGLYSTVSRKIDPPKGYIPPAKMKLVLTPVRLLIFCVCLGLFIVTTCFSLNRWTGWRDYLVQFSLVLELAVGLAVIFPGNTLDTPDFTAFSKEKSRRLSKRTLAALVMILAAIPLTIYVGVIFFDDRKYYFISLLIVLEAMLPFVLVFESREPRARELVVIAVLCAMGVAGRTAFFMLPQFKPVVALVIITGVCFGGETGFLVGTMTGFISNFFFGQGPWTPWQMFSFGLIGFLAGILFCKGLLRKKRSALCIFGGISTFIVYGVLMDTATVLMYQANPTWPAFLSAYALGIPFNIIHAAATVFFLWFISGPMIEKLDRIKVKNGLID